MRSASSAVVIAGSLLTRRKYLLLTRIKTEQLQATLQQALASARCQKQHQHTSLRWKAALMFADVCYARMSDFHCPLCNFIFISIPTEATVLSIRVRRLAQLSEHRAAPLCKCSLGQSCFSLCAPYDLNCKLSSALGTVVSAGLGGVTLRLTDSRHEIMLQKAKVSPPPFSASLILWQPVALCA